MKLKFKMTCGPTFRDDISNGLVYGVSRYFQLYVSYIVAVSFIGGENNQPAASHCQALSHNVVLSTPRHKQDLNMQL